jgi:hypothetical protein
MRPLTLQCYSEGLGVPANATRAAELFQVTLSLRIF